MVVSFHYCKDEIVKDVQTVSLGRLIHLPELICFNKFLQKFYSLWVISNKCLFKYIHKKFLKDNLLKIIKFLSLQ